MDASILSQAAERYGVRPDQLKPVHGGHFSAVYEFPYQGRACILRITPPNEHIGLPSLQSILAWMDFLADRGAPVTRPLASLQGHRIECLERCETYLAAAFEHAPGILAEDLPFEQWTPALYQALGRAAGQIHAAARAYSPAPGLRPLPTWERGSSYYRSGQPAGRAHKAVLLAHQKALAAVRALPRDPAAYGLIHADFHAANFFVDRAAGAITLFDFDDCCYGWFGMDVAMNLFDMLVLYPGQDKEVFALRFMRSYLAGYRDQQALDPFWLAQLPHFLKLLETSIYLEVQAGYDPSDHESWVGRFMQGRERRIEHHCPYVDLHFETL